MQTYIKLKKKMKKAHLIILGTKICHDLIFGLQFCHDFCWGGDEKSRLVSCLDMKTESHL